MISFVDNSTRVESIDESVKRLQKLTAKNHSELECRVAELRNDTSDWYSLLYKMQNRQGKRTDLIQSELLRLYTITTVLACVVVVLTAVVLLMAIGVL